MAVGVVHHLTRRYVFEDMMIVERKNKKFEYQFQGIRPYDLPPLYADIDNSLEWYTDHCGINVSGRFRRYVKNIKSMYRHLGCFSDRMYSSLHSINELYPLLEVFKYYQKYKDKEFFEIVKTSLKGQPFRQIILDYDDKEEKIEDKARSSLFELNVAKQFICQGETVDFENRADIIIHERNYIAECKRVISKDLLLERVAEGVKQIEGDQFQYFGDVYIDVTQLINLSHTVLTIDELRTSFMGFSTKEEVSEALSDIVEVELESFIKDYIYKINEIANRYAEKTQNIYFMYNFVGLHLCAAQQAAVLGQAKVLVWHQT